MKLIEKIINIFNKIFPTYTALNNLDKKMEKYLNYKNGFFIEMGANDGLNQSNTFFLEKKYKWKGILVEPSEKFYPLQKNRSKTNFFSNDACCSFANKNKLIKFSYNNLMTLALNLNTDINIKTHLKNAKKHNKKNYIFQKKGVPLNDLLIKHKAPKIIDFFSLDVEGAEFEVLNGINFKSYKFKYILLETRKFNRINKFLKKKNYKFLIKLSKKDYLFTHKK